MSPPATRKRARGKKKGSWPGWVRWWPLVLGIVVTPFAVRAASVLALTGPTALRTLYPYMVLVQNFAQHFSTEQAETLSQWILYGQFPLYGLLWVLAGRLLGRSAGPLLVLLLHAGGVGAAVFTTGG